MRRILFPLILGLGGIAILWSLGFWQLRRMEWKENLLSGIEARIHDAPVALPEAPNPDVDQYHPVTATGNVGDQMLKVLSGDKFRGGGYRIISPMKVGSRTILLDRGFLAEDEKPGGHFGEVTVTGNLLWPQEADSYTPPPDLKANIWFARDVSAMAAALGTEPVMIVVREGPNDSPITPSPVDTAGIPNNHLQYAITWFSLSAVWGGMTGLLVWRIRQKTA